MHGPCARLIVSRHAPTSPPEIARPVCSSSVCLTCGGVFVDPCLVSCAPTLFAVGMTPRLYFTLWTMLMVFTGLMFVMVGNEPNILWSLRSGLLAAHIISRYNTVWLSSTWLNIVLRIIWMMNSWAHAEIYYSFFRKEVPLLSSSEVGRCVGGFLPTHFAWEFTSGVLIFGITYIIPSAPDVFHLLNLLRSIFTIFSAGGRLDLFPTLASLAIYWLLYTKKGCRTASSSCVVYYCTTSEGRSCICVCNTCCFYFSYTRVYLEQDIVLLLTGLLGVRAFFMYVPLMPANLVSWQALPDTKVGLTLAGALSSMFSLFAGFMISPAKVPHAWLFAYYLNPLHYVVEVSCCVKGMCNVTYLLLLLILLLWHQ